MRAAVIMAGGLGARFWPITTDQHPKYALKFNQRETLLSATYHRLSHVFGRDNVYIITIEKHKKLITQLCPWVKQSHILTEPLRRNTGAAITYTMLLLKRRLGPHAVVSFFPADHAIRDWRRFRHVIQTAQAYARDSKDLVVLGVKPTYPATGYGYIASAQPLKSAWKPGRRVRRFVEKPTITRAKQFLRKKTYFWNSGMFIWSIASFEAAMHKTNARYFNAFTRLFSNRLSLKKARRFFLKLKPQPIDKLLMEKSRDIAVFPATFDWDDIGSWDAILRLSGKRNAIIGKAVVRRVTNSVVITDTQSLAVMGVEGMVVVNWHGKVLVCPLDASQGVSQLRREIEA